MRKLTLVLVAINSLLIGCGNPELTDKIEALEKSNQELTLLNEQLSATLNDTAHYFQMAVDELIAQNDSIEYYKSLADSLTRGGGKKKVMKSEDAKCDFGKNLVSALAAADQYYKGNTSYTSANASYVNAYSSFQQVRNSLIQKDAEDAQATMASIEGILEKDHYSGEERMSLQVWMVIAKKKCNEIKANLCK
jgi:hypothetical protein